MPITFAIGSTSQAQNEVSLQEADGPADTDNRVRLIASGATKPIPTGLTVPGESVPLPIVEMAKTVGRKGKDKVQSPPFRAGPFATFKGSVSREAHHGLHGPKDAGMDTA